MHNFGSCYSHLRGAKCSPGWLPLKTLMVLDGLERSSAVYCLLPRAIYHDRGRQNRDYPRAYRGPFHPGGTLFFWTWCQTSPSFYQTCRRESYSCRHTGPTNQTSTHGWSRGLSQGEIQKSKTFRRGFKTLTGLMETKVIQIAWLTLHKVGKLVWCTELRSHIGRCQGGGEISGKPFEQGYQFRSLYAYRSVISHVHDNVDRVSIGQHPLVTRVLRGGRGGHSMKPNHATNRPGAFTKWPPTLTAWEIMHN